MNTRGAWLLICCACGILLLALAAGCTQSPLLAARTAIPADDPEIAIVHWMDAMNRQDIVALYRLSPLYVRSDITLEQLAEENRNNVYFTRNVTFTSYEIANKTIDGDSADIKAMLVMREPPSAAEQEKFIPIWFHFTLSREKGEWKVWTIP